MAHDNDSKQSGPTSRRSFLKNSLSLFGKVAAANVGVYVIGSAFKNIDGSLVAGAKTWQDTGGSITCFGLLRVSGTPCTTPGATGRGTGLGPGWCRKMQCM